MGRIFSVSQDAHVLHIAGMLCLFVFSLAGLIGTGSSSSVKRQLAITLFILSLCTWLVDVWGLPLLPSDPCAKSIIVKLHWDWLPLEHWINPFFFKEIENCLVPSSSTALFHTIFWLYEGKGLEVKEFESLLIHQSCILICPKNILKSITIQKNVDCFDSKIEIQFIWNKLLFIRF